MEVKKGILSLILESINDKKINKKILLTLSLKILAPSIAIAIFILSSQSTLPLPPVPFFSPDKFAHFIAYGALALALAFWFSLDAWQQKPLKTASLVVIITSLYGISDELHQYFVPGRDSSVGDWLADSLGALTAVLIVCISIRLKKGKTKVTNF